MNQRAEDLERQALDAHRRGTTALADERFDDAKLAFAAAAELYTSFGREEDQASELFYAGMADQLAGRPSAAEHAYEAALRLYASLDLPQEQAAVYQRLGDLARASGRVNDALAAYEAARSAFQRSGAKREARAVAELKQELLDEEEEQGRTLFLLDEGHDSSLFDALGARLAELPWDTISFASPRSGDLRTRRGDVALYFLQPISGVRGLDQVEIVKRLERQGVSVVLVLREGPDTPPEMLASYAYVKYESPADVDTVLAKLAEAPVIDLDRLSPQAFESLVYELFAARGLLVDRVSAATDPGVDLVVKVDREDPLGFPYREEWAVQVKHTLGTRADLRTLRSFVGVLQSRNVQNALYVTSGQITSVAAEWLGDLAGPRIHTVDGVALRAAVTRHPAIARRYFSATDGD